MSPALLAHRVVSALLEDGLERVLRERRDALERDGYAVGVASALPLSIERLNAWAKAVEDHGILLVPLTTVMTKSKSS